MTIAELKGLIADLPDDYLVVLGNDDDSSNEVVEANASNVGYYKDFGFKLKKDITKHNSIVLWP